MLRVYFQSPVMDLMRSLSSYYDSVCLVNCPWEIVAAGYEAVWSFEYG